MSARPANGRQPKRPVPSVRRRRLRWTLGWLTGFGAIAIGLWVVLHLAARPEGYRPGQDVEGITRRLARGLPPEAPMPRFTEVSVPAGLAGFRNFTGARESELPEDMGPGLAWGDFDNDGDDDLFLVGAGGGMRVPDTELAPSILYENLGDGRFAPVTGFPETRIRGLGAAWGDYDGDGYLDLVVAGYHALRLFRNEGGTGRFTRDPRLPEPEGFWSGVVWGDFNHDRRLDLYVANYVQYETDPNFRDELSAQLDTFVPYTLNPASFAPVPNLLFQQQSDGSFREVAAELGVDNPEGRSLGALWHDFDLDGWLDLYVANDVSDNVFYRNTGGTFEDISHAAWVADYRSAMGLAVGDYDRDGDDDLFVTHWTAQENGFYQNLWADLNPPNPAAGQSPGTGSQRLPLRFIDIADQKGLGQIALRHVGWGTEFVDLDQDGWLDLLVANGHTIEAPGPAPKRLQPQESFLFWNRQGVFFHDLAPLHDGLQQLHVSRGLACADFDQDGDMDFAIADLGEGVRLLRNDMANGNWLKIRLRSRNPEGIANGRGYGSTAIAWVHGVPLRRSVTGSSYLSQSSTVLHWGLGDASQVDRVEVHWHAGSTQTFGRLEANTAYELTEDDPAPRRLATVPSSLPVSSTRTSPDSLNDRRRLTEFWRLQRAAMDALVIEQNDSKGVRLLREALQINPVHQDSRYYLGLALARLGKPEAALAELAHLQQLNPQSLRAWQQWAVLRARTASSDADLAAAEEAATRAHRLNPAESGALLVLGEITLLRGNLASAKDRLTDACRTNSRAAGGFFLLAYIAREQGDLSEAQRLLHQAREALGPDWQPEGTTSEGDTLQKHHDDHTPLAESWADWDGEPILDTAFARLEHRLRRIRSPSTESIP